MTGAYKFSVEVKYVGIALDQTLYMYISDRILPKHKPIGAR